MNIKTVYQRLMPTDRMVPTIYFATSDVSSRAMAVTIVAQ